MIDIDRRATDTRTKHGVFYFLIRSWSYRSTVFFGPEDHPTYRGWIWRQNFTGSDHEQQALDFVERLAGPAERIAVIMDDAPHGFRYQ